MTASEHRNAKIDRLTAKIERLEITDESRWDLTAKLESLLADRDEVIFRVR
jgi:hypothetical protein